MWKNKKSLKLGLIELTFANEQWPWQFHNLRNQKQKFVIILDRTFSEVFTKYVSKGVQEDHHDVESPPVDTFYTQRHAN